MVISETKPLAIIGGTYNPVHYGHLRAAIELAEAFELEKIGLMPCYDPVHRASGSLEPEHRLNMLNLALQDSPRLYVDERELRRKGPSFSIDSLAEIRQEVGDNTPLYFAMGADAFQGIQTWKSWKALLKFSHLIVMQRPGSDIDWQNDFFRERVRTFKGHFAAHGYVYKLPNSLLGISSTTIRKLTEANQSTHYLLPEPVRSYILRHQLYQLNI